MFKINKNKKSNTRLPIIDSSSYKILHFDEMPILFIGKNKFGNQIIGSSVEEDYKLGIERYFHIIVTGEDFDQFTKRKISYCSLLKNAGSIFVVDKHVNDIDKFDIYTIGFEDIPTEYMPVDDSFCPETFLTSSNKYSARLKGKIADRNQADPESAGETQVLIAKLIRSAFNNLKSSLKIRPEILLEPVSVGSFAINYNIEIKGELNLYTEIKDYYEYLNAYIEYCFNNLPEDIDKILDAEQFQFHLKYFDKLVDTYTSLYPSVDDRKKRELRENFKTSIYEASNILKSLSQHINNFYDQITIVNLSVDGENTLGIFDEKYKADIEHVVDTIQDKNIKKTVDEKPQAYSVLIYDLNTDTRIGHAIVQDLVDSKKFYKPQIHITGKEPIVSSKYTKSLHNNVFIDVLGKATKEGRVIKKMEIIYQFDLGSDDIVYKPLFVGLE